MAGGIDELKACASVHDRHRFELALEFPLPPPGREVGRQYVIDMYLYIPADLGIHDRTFPPAGIYEHLTNSLHIAHPWRAIEGSSRAARGERMNAAIGPDWPSRMRSAALANQPTTLTVASQVRPVAARDAGRIEAAFTEMVTKGAQVVLVADS